MINLRRNLLGIIMASALLTSCQKEDAADIEVVYENSIERPSQENAAKLWSLGVNPNFVFKTTQTNPDGKTLEGWKVSDVFIENSHLEQEQTAQNFGKENDNGIAKFYRFFNTVNAP